MALNPKTLACLAWASAMFASSFAVEKPLPPRPWENEIIYTIMVDRYSHDGQPVTADEKNPTKYWGGNLQGVIAHLDDLSDLGITTLLLTPVTDSASYHGYSVLDLFKINPHFGTLEDYQKLIAECHKRKIRILFDFVGNHMSEHSQTYAQHPDWFRQRVGAHAINGGISIKMWTHASFYNLPDLIQEKPEVYAHLLKAAKFWMDQGIDGFRMDAVTLVQPEFWKKFNKDLHRIAPPGFLILGEIWSTEKDQRLAYDSYFDAAFDFKLYEAYRYAPILTMMIDPLNASWEYGRHKVLPVRFFDNHDTGRLLSHLGGSNPTNLKRLHLYLVSLMISPGVPSLLYGTEFALQNISTSAGIFDWSRCAMQFKPYTDETRVLIKNLIHLRKEIDFNTYKRKWSAGNGMGGFVFAYYWDDVSKKELLVILNFGVNGRRGQVDLGEYPHVSKSSSFKDYFTEKTYPTDGGAIRISMEPYSFLILTAE